MTPHEFASRLEHFATRVRAIRPVDHRRPGIFFEDQSEVVAELMAEARAMRTVPKVPKSLPVMRPGIVVIPASLTDFRSREVKVEVRRKRA